jgi:hypothetical protein
VEPGRHHHWCQSGRDDPEGGFPKNIGIGAVIVPEEMVAVTWEKNGRSGVMVRAKSVKVEGGLAGTKAAA